MKTIELYVKVLRKVRNEILSKEETDLKLNDYEFNSKEYNYITQVNEACNVLSSLIDMMKEEIKD